MGWTGYYPTHFKSGGGIDRKAECDAYFIEGLNTGHYNLVKSSMVGNTYYAAVQPLKRYACDASGKKIQDANGNYVVENIPVAEIETIGIVILTQVEKGMFHYKEMSESMIPGCFDCPKSILLALSPTENEHSNEWRKTCWQKHEEKAAARKAGKDLQSLPIGTVIKFAVAGNEERWLVKRAANFQFKKPWWQVDGDNKYYSKKRIPENYEIVKIGGQ